MIAVEVTAVAGTIAFLVILGRVLDVVLGARQMHGLLLTVLPKIHGPVVTSRWLRLGFDIVPVDVADVAVARVNGIAAGVAGIGDLGPIRSDHQSRAGHVRPRGWRIGPAQARRSGARPASVAHTGSRLHQSSARRSDVTS